MKIGCLAILLGFFLSTACAASEYENLSLDDRLRFYELSKQFRCTVCQNQSVYDSMAPLAEDLKNQIAKMIQQQQTDSEIRDFFQQRYGDFVLFEPPLRGNTWLLWGGPLLLYLCAFIGIAWGRRSRCKT